MKDLNLPKLILGILIVGNLLVPILVIKMGFWDSARELSRTKKMLELTKKETGKIASVVENPETFSGYIQKVSDQRDLLRQWMPKRVEIIEAQKLLSQFAKASEVSIVALKPLEDEIPLYLDGGEGAEPVLAPGIQMGLIQIQVRGDYENLCSYFEDIENAKGATLAIDNLNIEQTTDAKGEPIEAKLVIRLMHSL